MKRRGLPWLIGLALLLSGAWAEMRVVRLDLMGPVFRAALARFAAEQARPVRIELQGSRLARDALVSGAAVVALLVTPEPESALPEGWVALPLAYHTLVVVTSLGFPISQIDLGQMREIFGAGTTTLTRWEDFGAPGGGARPPRAAHSGG